MQLLLIFFGFTYSFLVESLFLSFVCFCTCIFSVFTLVNAQSSREFPCSWKPGNIRQFWNGGFKTWKSVLVIIVSKLFNQLEIALSNYILFKQQQQKNPCPLLTRKVEILRGESIVLFFFHFTGFVQKCRWCLRSTFP